MTLNHNKYVHNLWCLSSLVSFFRLFWSDCLKLHIEIWVWSGFQIRSTVSENIFIDLPFNGKKGKYRMHGWQFLVHFFPVI